jgi:hypothetical protein
MLPKDARLSLPINTLKICPWNVSFFCTALAAVRSVMHIDNAPPCFPPASRSPDYFHRIPSQDLMRQKKLEENLKEQFTSSGPIRDGKILWSSPRSHVVRPQGTEGQRNRDQQSFIKMHLAAAGPMPWGFKETRSSAILFIYDESLFNVAGHAFDKLISWHLKCCCMAFYEPAYVNWEFKNCDADFIP